jgi:hypothetical protein
MPMRHWKISQQRVGMIMIKSLTKTKTIICANLYDSHYYSDSYSKSSFINASLQLVNDFPEVFQIVESSMVHVIIKTIDIKKCFELYKYNEEKIIHKPRIKS